MSLVLGLSLVWCNIERMDLAYDLKIKQVKLDEKTALLAKLEVERENLLSPYRLRQKAREYGLGPADQGRIRHLWAKVRGSGSGTGVNRLQATGTGKEE